MYFFFEQYILLKLFLLLFANYSQSEGTNAEDDNKDYTVCRTVGCKATAKNVKTIINEKIDPCEDFYQFACGRFLSYDGIEENSYCPNDMAEVVSDIAAAQVKEVLDSPINSHDIRPFRLAKKLYRLCMEEEKFGLKHVELVNKYLQIFGGWPVVEGSSWNEKTFDWIELIIQFIKYGFHDDSIFNIVAGVNFKNTSQKMLDLDHPDLAFEREYLIRGLRGKAVRAYYKYMLDVAMSFGAKKSLASVELKESLQFEVQIARITSPMDKRHHNFGKQFNIYTLARLVKVYPYIPWEEILSLYTKQNMSAMPDLLINVSSPDYYIKLGELLKKTKKRVLANFLIWRAVSDFIQMLPTSIFQSHLNLLRKITGRDMLSPKFESCGDVVSDGMDIAVGAIYARKYFNNQVKKLVIDMTQRIKREMINILVNVDWMDEKTRAFALRKAKAMEFHVAYPDEFSEDKNIEEFYKMLEFPDNYLLSTLSLGTFGCNITFDKLDTAYNRSDWTLHSSVHEINACYAPQENSVGVPAALLQNVYFEKDRPMYMNYGAIGSVIAHEVTHGFDEDGRYFDQNGNLFNWWDEESTKNYDTKAQHIIKHYANYTVSDVNMKLDGELVHGESIADHGALKIAYNAYKGWIADNGEESRLPSLEKYRPLQMFWISNAQIWCTRIIKEELSLQLITDYHAPAEYRVNGPMRNSEQFAEEFECPIGSFMNPLKRVNVW